MVNTRRSITVYYCSSRDNFINDISKISSYELKELLSYAGNDYVCLCLSEIKKNSLNDNIVYSDWVTGSDEDYLDKLCKWFECDNIKELEMKVKLWRGV